MAALRVMNNIYYSTKMTDSMSETSDVPIYRSLFGVSVNGHRYIFRIIFNLFNINNSDTHLSWVSTQKPMSSTRMQENTPSYFPLLFHFPASKFCYILSASTTPYTLEILHSSCKFYFLLRVKKINLIPIWE